MLACAVALLQVAVSPAALAPAGMERVAVRVANPAESPVIAVRVEVPEALAVLGIDTPSGWTSRLVPASDTSPQAIEWSGGTLERGAFREFAFFARLGAAARQLSLVLPVELHRADGGVRRWRPGGDGPAPEIQVRGSVGVTAGGAFTLAAAAAGLAALGIALALRPKRG